MSTCSLLLNDRQDLLTARVFKVFTDYFPFVWNFAGCILEQQSFPAPFRLAINVAVQVDTTLVVTVVESTSENVREVSIFIQAFALTEKFKNWELLGVIF